MKMPLALANGQRQDPQPETSGACICCGEPVVAKCGPKRVWHWAHKSGRRCDPWWENETDWHRSWKGQFPKDWHEKIQHASDRERHIADVKTDQGWVLEFQHSPIKAAERDAREAFYKKLVWVVDGLRLKRDRPRFLEHWEVGAFAPIGPILPVRIYPSDFPLIEEWAGSTASVFFDFGDEDVLWWLLASRRANGPVYLAHFPRAEFIDLHRRAATQTEGGFDWLVEAYRKYVTDYESNYRAPVWIQVSPQPLPHFLRYQSRSQRLERFMARNSRRL